MQNNHTTWPQETQDFLDDMRYAGQLAANVLTFIKPFVRPGVSTETLDAHCHQLITQTQRAVPACLGYKGFPKSVCISVNEVVCHGIPGPKLLKNGDIVNIDVTVYARGVHGDTSMMFFVGEPSIQAKRLCEVTQVALYTAIQQVKPGVRLGIIGQVIEKIAKQHHYSVVRAFCGHFIGRAFHEQPDVLHFAGDDKGFILEPGMTFTIEPMINVGKPHVRIMRDGWTAKTKDHSLSAQYEHTLLVTQTGYEVLTWREAETLERVG